MSIIVDVFIIIGYYFYLVSFQSVFEAVNHTRARTSAWVAATTRSFCPGGRRMRTPGDRIKARMARIRNMVRFIFSIHTQNFTNSTQ